MNTSINEKLDIIICKKNIDAILITDKYSLRYIAGYRGEGIALIQSDEKIIFTDSRYTEQVTRECPAYKCIDINGDGYGKTIKKNISSYVKKIGFENNSISFAEYKMLKEKLSPIEFVELDSELDNLRIIKTEEEIENIRTAEEIGDAAFSHILKKLKVGMTEKEIALELEYFMKKNGAEGLSFDTIAASGVNSSMPHAIPTDKEIKNGELLTMDFGCVFQGYCSDMTRTVAIGNVGLPEESVYSVVLKAQLEAMKAIKPGVRCNEIDRIARNIISDAGYGHLFGHGLGHSVGLFIHENPRFSPKCDTVLEKGMVITVEPGIYLPGKFGVRIEDLIAVTEHGYINLTKSNKDLIQI